MAECFKVPSGHLFLRFFLLSVLAILLALVVTTMSGRCDDQQGPFSGAWNEQAEGWQLSGNGLRRGSSSVSLLALAARMLVFTVMAGLLPFKATAELGRGGWGRASENATGPTVLTDVQPSSF